jgi:small-conductance mechanosensitive channel
VLWGAHWALLARRGDLGAESRLPRQILLLVLTAVGLVAVLLLLPISDSTRGQVLSLLGIVLTGVIGLSSATFVSNAMAGLMLRMISTFRPGDFITIGGLLGRVTERGLFHTEIQTEDRELTTFPNLYLVTNPVTVVRSSGTIISATLSLGYDVPRLQVEELLKQAALAAELEEPFVHVRELGDFSVSYRVAGFLPEVRHLLTMRSVLRKKILDVLHANGIEIVSPTFMNQRRLEAGQKIIPRDEAAAQKKEAPVEAEEAPEALIFDKAEEAEQAGRLQYEHSALAQRLEALKARRKEASADEQAAIDSEIAAVEEEMAALALALEAEKKP